VSRVPEPSFRLLGQVEAWQDGHRVELGGRMQRALLAALLVRCGRVVALDRLIDDLWPDNPPARAAATVQVFVSSLRRALEPGRARGEAARVLVTTSPGYLIDVDPDAVDAHAFSRIVGEGRAALDGDDPERAADLLRAADALWHGPALADLTGMPFARLEATRLEELRLSAVEDRVEAELALGRHVALVAELEELVARHPLRERPQAQLMLALYRSGRQAAALEVYKASRRLLHDELGLEPGARLRELEHAVLRHDPQLGWEPAAEVVMAPAPEAAPAHRPELDEPGRVLVVDDSSVNRRLLVAALTGLGHEAHAVANGRAALELLRSGTSEGGFDVVLLDLLMPVMDGFATLAAIKGDPALAHVPVIMVSAVPELESVVRCIDLGATDYLAKPFSSAVLRARLRSSLAAKRLRDVERDRLRHAEHTLHRMTREVSDRETALQAEIAALRAEVVRSRADARAPGDRP
jgi:DNA-binding SARP family transcriptional activator/CheY-like chemotaxis protein